MLRHSGAALAAGVLAPAAAVALVLRPSWRIGWRERLGGGWGALENAPAVREDGCDSVADDRVASLGSHASVRDRIWVHAASAGEARAALGLIDRLADRGHELCASAFTVAGRDLLRAERPKLPINLAPLDHLWCVGRALRDVAPSGLVLIETEIWPGWLAECRRRDIPVVVASGRISDRAFPRYQQFARWLRPAFAGLSAVAARTQQDAERFVALGVPEARVSVTGDLKSSETRPDALASDLARRLQGLPAVVFGSTHSGEDIAALSFLAAAEAADHPVLAIVAPRHLSRVDAVVEQIERAGRTAVLRTQLATHELPLGAVLVLDSIGELAALYGVATLAFVGGTLVEIGGHNLLEPLRAGCPVVCGPHTENVREVVAAMQRSGAGRSVRNADEVAHGLVALLSDPAQLDRARTAAREVARRDAGSAERIADLIEATFAGASFSS
jgi:3-deoxy-D-manno-octulosonic-acid transferase